MIPLKKNCDIVYCSRDPNWHQLYISAYRNSANYNFCADPQNLLSRLISWITLLMPPQMVTKWPDARTYKMASICLLRCQNGKKRLPTCQIVQNIIKQNALPDGIVTNDNKLFSFFLLLVGNIYSCWQSKLFLSVSTTKKSSLFLSVLTTKKITIIFVGADGKVMLPLLKAAKMQVELPQPWNVRQQKIKIWQSTQLQC